MRWKCCPLCTGTHDTWDCPKAQRIVESHTGLVSVPEVVEPLPIVSELPREPKRARWHQSVWENGRYTVIR